MQYIYYFLTKKTKLIKNAYSFHKKMIIFARNRTLLQQIITL